MRLPKVIEDIIFDDLNAEYSPLRGKARFSLQADEERIKKDLGTYFPRSFVEAYRTFQDLLSSTKISSVLGGRKEIYVLDVGSGLGGYLLGFLWALIEKSDKFSDKEIYVISIDGNKFVIELQEKIIGSIPTASNVLLETVNSEVNPNDSMVKELHKLIAPYSFTYDLIIFSKLGIELLSRPDDSEEIVDVYMKITKFAENCLMSHGMLIINDITAPPGNLIDTDIFIPKVINAQLARYTSQNSSKLRCIIPLSCAFWYEDCEDSLNCFHQKTFKVSHRGVKEVDETRVAYRILTHKEFAEEVLGEISCQDCYKITEKNYCLKGNYHYNLPEPPSKPCYDAFSLANAHIPVEL